MYSMFFLKGKKVSGNHNNPSEMSHYFLFSAFYLSAFTPWLSPKLWYLWCKRPPSSCPCCEASCFSHLGVNHDIMNGELSLVCHMKHSGQKSSKTKKERPFSTSFYLCFQLTLHFCSEWALHGEKWMRPGCLETRLRAGDPNLNQVSVLWRWKILSIEWTIYGKTVCTLNGSTCVLVWSADSRSLNGILNCLDLFPFSLITCGGKKKFQSKPLPPANSSHSFRPPNDS